MYAIRSYYASTFFLLINILLSISRELSPLILIIDIPALPKEVEIAAIVS